MPVGQSVSAVIHAGIWNQDLWSAFRELQNKATLFSCFYRRSWIQISALATISPAPRLLFFVQLFCFFPFKENMSDGFIQFLQRLSPCTLQIQTVIPWYMLLMLSLQINWTTVITYGSVIIVWIDIIIKIIVLILQSKCVSLEKSFLRSFCSACQNSCFSRDFFVIYFSMQVNLHFIICHCCSNNQDCCALIEFPVTVFGQLYYLRKCTYIFIFLCT